MASNSQEILTLVFLYSCIGVELVCISYLLILMSRPRSPLRKAYFIISVIGYMVDVAAKLNEAIDEYSLLSSYFQWHTYYFFGIWHFVLTLNRFTSVVYWQTYEMMWSLKKSALWCLGILAYPVLVDITFVLIEPQPFYCVTYLYRSQCRDFYAMVCFRQSISNILTSISSLTMSLITIIKIRKTSAPSKIASRLLVQCVVLTMFFSVFMAFLVVYSIAWQSDNVGLIRMSATVLNNSLYFYQSFGVCWLVIICHFMVRGGSNDVKVSSVGQAPATPVRARAASVAQSHF
uniref:Serpentine receptor class gamma n=1 Tax=Panagrellus redivivus TaxID=6233 RepID=A0A7E4VD62_PANRE